MKKFKIILVLIAAITSFNSCEKDELVFTAQAPGEFAFTNDFLTEYVLTSTTSANIGERFTWESQSFEAPTAVSYELQGSVLGDFTDMTVIGSTSGNDLAVTVGKLLSMASDAGLDNDPDTDNPNTGDMYFRLRAYSGNNAIETLSAVQTLTLVLPEIVDNGGGSGISISSWGVVGSGYNNWGAFADAPFYTTDAADVYVAYVTLVDGAIKFREDNAWDNNFGDSGADGTLDAGGDDIIVTAGNYKITLNLSDNTYTMENYSWGVVGSAYNNWGNAYDHDDDPTTPEVVVPDAKFYYDYTTDTFKVGVKLLDGAMKVRFNNNWDLNYGDTGADGTLDEGGDDIIVTAGHYLITVDLNNGTYTAVAADVPGIVGSAYNDWGGDGPDFSLTEISAGLFVGDIVTLLDGAFKFRMNNAWDLNYGDTGADGTIDENGDDIVATAGMYRVLLNTTEGTYTMNALQ